MPLNQSLTELAKTTEISSALDEHLLRIQPTRINRNCTEALFDYKLQSQYTKHSNLNTDRSTSPLYYRPSESLVTLST